MDCEEIPEEFENGCPKCFSDLLHERCPAMGCDGGVCEDDDDMGGVEYEPCADCLGTGFMTWCRECGWDDVFKCFLSPKYEAEFLAKQAAENVEQK